MASLSRVIEPRPVQSAPTRRPRFQGAPNDVALAQAMTRQSAALRTSVMEPSQGFQGPQGPQGSTLPTEHWYRVEDPYTTAETDAAFARFMAGDNPHLRTDEVPVVDFTSMIPAVDANGRPVTESRRESRIKLAVAALATTAILGLAVVFGFIDVPGADRVVPDAIRSTTTAPVADAPASDATASDGSVGATVDAQSTQPADAPEVLATDSGDAVLTDDVGEQQPLSITSGD